MTMAFGETKDSPMEICGDQAKVGLKSTVCVAPPNHADYHLDRKGRQWYLVKNVGVTVEEPSKVSIARLRAIGYNEWADQAIAEWAKRQSVLKAARSANQTVVPPSD